MRVRFQNPSRRRTCAAEVTPLLQDAVNGLQPYPFSEKAICLFRQSHEIRPAAGRKGRRPRTARPEWGMERKTAIVTGGSRGIGAATAAALANAGFDVAINCRSGVEKANEVAALCREAGAKAEVYPADVSDFAACGELVKQVLGDFGRIDALVNNAGITRDTLLLRMSEEQFDQVIAGNLKSVFNMTKAVAPVLTKRRAGRIINITSVSGIAGNAGQANYAAAKAGIIGFTKTVAKELGSRGITVNAVAPGFVETDMTAVLPDELKEAAQKSISLRRLGKPEEIASLVAFLAGDGASYITGQVLVADGGLSL